MFIGGKRKKDDCPGNNKNDAGEPEDPITRDPVPDFHFDLNVGKITYCFDIESFASWLIMSGHNIYPITQIRRYTEIDMDSVRRPKNPITNKPLTNEEILDFAEVLEEFWASNPKKKPKPEPLTWYYLTFKNDENGHVHKYPIPFTDDPEEMKKNIEETYHEKLLEFLEEEDIPTNMRWQEFSLNSIWRTLQGELLVLGGMRHEGMKLKLEVFPSMKKLEGLKTKTVLYTTIYLH